MSIASPCINACQLNPSRAYCQGCLRTLDEIRAWSKLSDPDKLAVWQRLKRTPCEQSIQTA
ncbi:DUF1289 domain-containing protein [Deefgea tanakiae]|uniref:DUF1289 domain-containing protein n=1 Tax=Deefgea tanakiae TaxID=2865840 RepID=A0ABX8Z6Z8_9NEIS|nr:DUF1289 domain-containing protein [Deefgea tanakiae]QZA77570.1 DUF1289 domain-containing protein [Deefgea tanakiae]